MSLPGTVTHPWRRDEGRQGRRRRPVPLHPYQLRVEDDEVVDLRAFLRRHGVTSLLEAAVADRPGPRLSVSPEALLVGMFLAARHRRSSNLDDVSEILWFSLYPAGRALLDLPRGRIDPRDTFATQAAYHRVQRTLRAVTTALDPHRHDRRRRLTSQEIQDVRAGWDANPEKVSALSRLIDALIHASIAEAEEAGALTWWDGAIGVDDTCATPYGLPPSRDKALDPHAGWYFKGGDEAADGIWAVATMLAFTGQPHYAPRDDYLQYCLGLRNHVPGSGGDATAAEIIESFDARFDPPKAEVVGDRYFSSCVAEKFQNRIRATGRDVVFDYKIGFLGRQDKPTTSPTGAIWAAGVPYCPATPEALLDAGKLLAKGTSRDDKREGQRLIELSLPYTLHTKQKPTTPGGSYRMSCPAAGPQATVTCPRREQRLAPPPTTRRTVIKKKGPRDFEPSTAALPRTQPSPLPADTKTWPLICQFDSVTFQPQDNAKLRQPYPHGSRPWLRHYRRVRGQNEGGNGTDKDLDIDIGDPKRRKPRGTVALTLQLAVQITVANLGQLNKWLIGRPPTAVARPTADDTTETETDRTDADSTPLTHPMATGPPPPT